MKFNKLTIQFTAPDISFAEEMICDIFFSFNLKGVVCDVPLEEPDEGFGTHTLPVPEICSITGFLPLLDASELIIEKILKKVDALSGAGIKTKADITVVDEEEWADAWKEYFNVTKITDRITVRPQWRPHTPEEGEIVIDLDPGMAFGTGTHPTTAMCLELIETHLTQGVSFLDVGTGSGILMIAAKKLGAGPMTGIDTDEVAIQVTCENLEQNSITPADLTLACTTLDQTPKTVYGFIAANIIAQVIVDILPQIAERMDENSTAVLSGIIKERLPDVMEALEKSRLFVIQESFTDEWVALAIKKVLQGLPES